MSIGLFCTLYGIGTILTAIAFSIVLGWSEYHDAWIPPDAVVEEHPWLMGAAHG